MVDRLNRDEILWLGYHTNEIVRRIPGKSFGNSPRIVLEEVAGGIHLRIH